jgi:uncharacterized membrane protein HdeD (DUF308 family)
MERRAMLNLLARNWWSVGIRGVAAIALGIVALVSPNIALLSLVYVFGAYALVDGVFAIISAVRGDPATRGHGFYVAVIGIAGIIAGIGSFVLPEITALTLLYIVAIWAIITGAFAILAAYRLRKEIEGELFMAIGGIASIAFGILAIVFPGSGLLSIIWLLGVYAIIFGVSLLALAWRLRSLQGAAARTMPGSMRSTSR